MSCQTSRPPNTGSWSAGGGDGDRGGGGEGKHRLGDLQERLERCSRASTGSASASTHLERPKVSWDKACTPTRRWHYLTVFCQEWRESAILPGIPPLRGAWNRIRGWTAGAPRPPGQPSAPPRPQYLIVSSHRLVVAKCLGQRRRRIVV